MQGGCEIEVVKKAKCMVWEHGGDQAEDCSGASLLAARGLPRQ